jgi:hypothetical protein
MPAEIDEIRKHDCADNDYSVSFGQKRQERKKEAYDAIPALYRVQEKLNHIIEGNGGQKIKQSVIPQTGGMNYSRRPEGDEGRGGKRRCTVF